MFRLLAVFVLPLLYLPLRAQSYQGGPDGFGYCFESSQDPGDTVRFSWLDPAGHTPITSWEPDPDDGWAIVRLPGRFPFYGDTLDSIVVCTNGFLEHPTTFTANLNLPLPVSTFPSLIALFWDDLNPAAAGEILRYDDPANTFTAVTWRNVVRFGTNETLTCQILLFADGRVRFNYLRMPADSRSSTIGIQGSSGASGRYLEYAHNGEPAGHVPCDSTSIAFFVRRLQRDVGVLRVNSPVGWVPAGQQIPVSAAVRNCGFEPATFSVFATIIGVRYPNDTVFRRSTTVADLAPGDTIDCYAGDLLTGPSPDSWRVIFHTYLAGDQYPRNDTARQLAFSVPPAFGSVLSKCDIPGLGSGYNLAGISFCSDSNRFFLAVNEPNRVMSFPSADPRALRDEPFELQNFFGDDIIWGIAWDEGQPGFWLTHVSERNTGCILARYNHDGSFAGDTWDVTGTLPNTWLAGIDCASDNTIYATSVGAENSLYHLDPFGRAVLGRYGEPTASWRACSWLGDRNLYLLTGGWNHHLMVQLNRGGDVIRTSPAPDLADLDIYQPSPLPADSFIWVYRTLNNDRNTVEKVSLGLTWSNTGVCERPAQLHQEPMLSVLPNPVRGSFVSVRHRSSNLPARLELWDAAGRLISTTPVRTTEIVLSLSRSDGRRMSAGVYLLRLITRNSTANCKLVIMPDT